MGVIAGPTAAAVGLLAALSAPAVHAQTLTPIISNLSEINSTDQTTGPTMFNTTSDRLAQSFITNAAYTNTSLYAKLDLALQSTSISTSDVMHLYLYNDGPGTILNGAYINGSQPTTLFADLGTATVNSTTTATYTFISSSGYTLASGTQYWLVLQDDANSNASWNYTTSTTYTGPGTVDPDAATGSSPDAGNSWLVEGLTFTDPNTNQSMPYGEQLFEFGTSVGALPEPETLPLLAFGAFGASLLWSARHRRRAVAVAVE